MNSRTTMTDGFPAARLGRGVASLTHDAVTIAELQSKLLAVDLKEGSRSLRNGAILAVVGGALLLACLPVGMLGVAELLVALAGWRTWVAYLVCGGVGLAVGLLLVWLCWQAIRKSVTSFRRSSQEFSRNLEWFKRMLRSEAGPGESVGDFTSEPRR